jgi:hypothetical protein
MVSWESMFADTSASAANVEASGIAKNALKLDLDIHSQETFLEARVDLHDGK